MAAHKVVKHDEWLCALHGPLPFNLMRSAVVAGARYGLSCLGCSAALMVAMVLLGMSSLWWDLVTFACTERPHKVQSADGRSDLIAQQ
jgi:hypothetical protein